MEKQKQRIAQSDIGFEQFTEDIAILEQPVTKYESAPSELPIGMYDKESKRWFRGYTIEKMSADALIAFEDEANQYRSFGALVAKSLSKIFDVVTGEEYPDWKKKTSKLFFPDVFFLMVETLIKTKGSSLVPTVYRCPKCGKFTKFENPIGQSGRADVHSGFDLLADDEELSSLEMEDIRSVPFNPVRDLDEPIIRFEFEEGVTINGVTYKKYEFRIPEIGDYILRGGGNKRGKQVEKEVFYTCLISVNDITGRDLEKLKNQVGIALMGLSVIEYMEIVKKMNSFGYDYTQHKTRCFACGYEYKTVFDLSNFFASVLGR